MLEEGLSSYSLALRPCALWVHSDGIRTLLFTLFFHPSFIPRESSSSSSPSSLHCSPVSPCTECPREGRKGRRSANTSLARERERREGKKPSDGAEGIKLKGARKKSEPDMRRGVEGGKKMGIILTAGEIRRKYCE